MKFDDLNPLETPLAFAKVQGSPCRPCKIYRMPYVVGEMTSSGVSQENVVASCAGKYAALFAAAPELARTAAAVLNATCGGVEPDGTIRVEVRALERLRHALDGAQVRL